MLPVPAFLPFGSPSFSELAIILVIGLLLFGKKLPDVARSLGKGLIEFKRGVQGIENEVNTASYSARSTPGSSKSRPVPEEEDHEPEMTAPKFEPPAAGPAVADSTPADEADTTKVPQQA
ncbi:MAG: twin-arginine translocase TatA/TatE family subunit [Planctomycetaceae bacterium]